jgi:hypothetical protein
LILIINFESKLNIYKMTLNINKKDFLFIYHFQIYK